MSVHYIRNDAVAHIRLARGDSLNAMDRAMYRDTNAAFRKFQDDPEARVAILSSSNEEAFCAGVDIKDVHRALTIEKLGMEELKEQFSLFFEAPGAVAKPVIGAIHGHCTGEGLVMTLFCDLRLASEDATFSLPEATIGVPSINGTIRAVQLIGYAAAMELVLTGQTRDAHWAARVGLVNAVVARDRLLGRAMELAESIAGNDAASIAIMHHIGQRALEESFTELVDLGSRLRDRMQTDAMIDRQGRFVDGKED